MFVGIYEKREGNQIKQTSVIKRPDRFKCKILYVTTLQEHDEPGAIPLTRMPNGSSSCARVPVK